MTGTSKDGRPTMASLGYTEQFTWGSEQGPEPPVAKRHWGKYRGTVVDNQDTPPSGRLLVSVPGIVITNWAMPCVPLADILAGTFVRPRIGANVWVEFERGDPDKPIWVGCWWGEDDIPILARKASAVPVLPAVTIETATAGISICTPAQSFLAGTNASGQTTITFLAPLPAGTGNISASYRAGDGSQGNVQASQITQLLGRPASLSSVTNPLPATGGGGDDQESVRAAVPGSLNGLGRVVTVSDYGSLASSIAGVGKASAVLTPGAGVVVTIAGTDPVQRNPCDSLCQGVAKAITEVADPALPVQVLPASLYLIALTADVVPDPHMTWDATVAAVRAALLASFGYAQRDLGQDVAVSDLLAAGHAAPGVLSFTVTGLALVPEAAPAAALSTTLPILLTGPVPAVATLAAVPSQWKLAAATPAPAAVAYLSGTVPGTLILSKPSP